MAVWLAGQWDIVSHGCCMCTVVVRPTPFAAAAATAAVLLHASQVSLPWLVPRIAPLYRRCTSPSRGFRLACCTIRLWMGRWPSLPQHAASMSRWAVLSDLSSGLALGMNLPCVQWGVPPAPIDLQCPPSHAAPVLPSLLHRRAT